MMKFEPSAAAPGSVERFTGDAQTAFAVLLAVARDQSARDIIPVAVREATTRLGTGVATHLTGIADRLQGKPPAAPIDLDEPMGAVERTISAQVELGRDTVEAWRGRLALYRELAAAVMRLEQDDPSTLRTTVAPIPAIGLSAGEAA